MTLEELKLKTYALIEEYSENADALTEDEDLATKMNSVINQIQNELARFKKIDAYKTIEVTEGQELLLTDIDTNIYQLNLVRGVDADPLGNRILFNETGTAKIFYFVYPTQINEETDDDFVLDLSTDVLEIMPYGIASDLLKSDVSSNYGAIYRDRYQELKQTLDSRKIMHGMYIEGGV